MAILHVATLTPTKAEIISSWLPAQPWALAGDAAVELVGAYRFDDPNAEVGIEVHLVRSAGTLLQVPLTYRDAPLAGAEGSLLGTMEHTALGQRWVYDGLGDAAFTRMLAAVAMTGCGQAVGMIEHEGRWIVAPPQVRLAGGGWTSERVPVDGFVVESDTDDWAVLRNDRFELRLARRPEAGAQPAIGLTGTWAGQGDPMVLATVTDTTPG